MATTITMVAMLAGLAPLEVRTAVQFLTGPGDSLLTGLVCAAAGEIPPQKSNPGIKRDRFLLLDSRIVERTKNAKLAVGKVQKAERNTIYSPRGKISVKTRTSRWTAWPTSGEIDWPSCVCPG